MIQFTRLAVIMMALTVMCVPAKGSLYQGADFVADGTVVYRYNRQELISQEITSGRILWTLTVPTQSGGIDVAPVRENDTLVFCAGGSGQRIIGVNVETGRVIWNRDGYCRAVVADFGHVYVLHRPDGSISCLDIKSGKTLWENIGNGPATSLLIEKGEVISDKIAVNKSSGKTTSKFGSNSILLGSVDNSLFWSDHGRSLRCTDVSGKELWHRLMPLAHIVQFEPGVQAEYVTAYDDYPGAAKAAVLLKLDPTGNEIWRKAIDGIASLPPAIVSRSAERLYVTLPVNQSDVVILGISNETGKELSKSARLLNVVGPVVEADGRFLLGTRDGKLVEFMKDSAVHVRTF